MVEHQIKVIWSKQINADIEQANLVPEESGVYEYSSSLGEDTSPWKRYVGKADDLRDRFKQHLSKDETNPCLIKMFEKTIGLFRYAIITNKADREDAELGLYEKYHTEINKKYDCNKIKPSGSGRENFKITEEP